MSREINESGLKIEYSIRNDSFDFQGPNGSLTHKLEDYPEIESISVYVEYLDEWIDVTNNKTMMSLAENLVQETYQSRKQE